MMTMALPAMLDAVPRPAERPLTLRVTAEAERRLRFGHPWLYPEAIRKQSRAGVAGDLAAIYDRRQRFLAIGLYDPMSPIRVRVLQRHRPAPIDRVWLERRLAAAVARRAPLTGDRQTTGYRLVHGENDGLPGVVVDRYDETLVLKLYTAAWVPHLREMLAALASVAPAARVVLRVSRAVQAQQAQLHGLVDGLTLMGPAPRGPVRFMERGLLFHADVLRGNKTGFFLDQRDNRAEVERLSRGRCVLDVFASSGAFSVCAARGGAAAVTTVELSRAALEAARRHMTLNRTFPSVARAAHRCLAGDGFEVLAALAKRREQFDLVILDPPSFAKTKGEIGSALAAYRRLTQLALALLLPDGLLVASCCSGQVSEDMFLTAVRQAAAQVRRSLRTLKRTGHPLDHPVGFPEGAYLKCLFASVAAPRRFRGGGSPAMRTMV